MSVWPTPRRTVRWTLRHGLGPLRAAAPRDRGERGFVLLVVLTAIGVFSVLVVAMLGLVLTDLEVSRVGREVPAFTRAIDGALETAVNEIKTSPDGMLGQAASGCASLDDPTPLRVEVEGTTVELTCTPLAPVEEAPPVPSTAGAALTLLGGYTGPIDLAANATAVMSGAVFSGISGAAQAWSNQLASSMPGLAHVGPQPLRIKGDVGVKQWAFGYRHDGTGQPASSPAIDIDGGFRQGNLGTLGGLGFWILGQWVALTPSCGILDSSFPLLPDQGLRIRATKGLACGNSGHASLADPHWAPPAVWDAGTLAQFAVASMPGDCTPVNGVVTIAPGYYDRNRSAVLNSWFRAGRCDDVTFWFPPGDYYFDVAGGGGDPSAQGALVFDDPTANWVWGAPHGWDPATGRSPGTAFPEACSLTEHGVSVTLSGRTSLQHRRGLVAMCPRRNADGSPRVLVYQEALPPQVRWGAEPAGATSIATTQPAFADPVNATASVAPAPSEFPDYGGPYDDSEGATRRYATATCGDTTLSCDPAIVLTGFTNPDAPAYQGSISNVRLWLRGQPSSNVSAPGDLICAPNCSATGVQIDFVGGGSCLLYQWDVPRGLYAFDLNGCRTQGLEDATQLDGATVKVVPLLRKRPEACGWIIYPIWHVPCTPMSFSLDYAWLDVTINAPSAPSQFGSLVDATEGVEGVAGSSITFFGPVYAPRSDLYVGWGGGATSMPVFGGGLVAKSVLSLATTPTSQVGILAAPAVRPGMRRVLVLARVGDRLRGSAVVTVTDSNPTGVFQPGRLLQVEDWRLCNAPWDPERTTPCPT